MVMLEMLLESGFLVTAINIEHGIRGKDSQKDTDFVLKYCKKRGVECLPFTVNAPEYAKAQGISVELAARILRYRVFDDLLKNKTVDTIALAHHKGDQAETLLMRLFRGTGVRGLRGIVDRVGYIHPLLNRSKAEILQYAKERNIPFVSDATNADSAYTRNFIRNEVMPLVANRYPNAEATLSRTAEVFLELEDYLLSEITPHTREGNAFFLPLTTLNRHGAIAKKSVAECLRAMGIENDIEFSHLEAIIRLKDLQNNAKIDLPFGVEVIKEYERLAFVKKKDVLSFCQPFGLHNAYRLNGAEYAFIPHTAKGCSTFDPDRIPPNAVVRTRRKGDTFKKIGGGSKPLAEYFTDIKMPLRLRDSALLIASGNNILAVLDGDVGEALKITNDSKKIYKIIKREDK